jgi:hypothetical protein
MNMLIEIEGGADVAPTDPAEYEAWQNSAPVVNNNQALIEGLKNLRTWLSLHPDFPKIPICLAQIGAHRTDRETFVKWAQVFGNCKESFCQEHEAVLRFGPVRLEVRVKSKEIMEFPAEPTLIPELAAIAGKPQITPEAK